MVNQGKKIEKKYVEQKMKQPMSRREVYVTFQAMMDNFKDKFMKENGFMLAQTVHFLNALLKMLIAKGIFTKEEFDQLSEELGNQEKAEFEKRKSEQEKKNGSSETANIKSNRKE